MQKLFFLLLFLSVSLFVDAQEYSFNHGPYIQNLDNDAVSIFFSTSAKGLSWVEVRRAGTDEITQFFTIEAGLVEAYNTSNAIDINGLLPNTEYQYRLISKEITQYRPYHIIYGDSISTGWENFKTLNPKGTSFSFVVMNDGHENPAKLKTLFSKAPMKKAEMVFYVGDMTSYYEKEGAPYGAFIDVSVENFAKNKPFVVVRGNHETRGCLARDYGKFVGRPNNRYYNVYYIGNTAIVMLDTGEDKPDSHPVYAGMGRFDDYRAQQALWFESLMKTKKFKQAKNRIVMMHIPPVQTSDGPKDEEYTSSELKKLFLPLFNDAKIDLLISGHTHQHFYFAPHTKGANFPILINDHRSAAFVEVLGSGVKVNIVNDKDEKTFTSEFKK